MKLNKKDLPFYAALVQTIQYGIAGWLLLGWLGVVGLGTMGALVSFSTAYATSQFSDIAQKRKGAAMVFLVLLMAFSPILIGTATFLHLTQITVPIWRVIVSAAWGFLPDGSTALVGFITGKGLVAQSEETATKFVAGPKKSKKSVAENQQSVAPATIPVAPPSKYPHECGVNGCRYVIKNAQSVGGHMKAKHPVSLGIFETAVKEQFEQ